MSLYEVVHVLDTFLIKSPYVLNVTLGRKGTKTLLVLK